ncbi:MAG: NAD(+)/NADH kinase [Lachnospiraceae bacterium]|nr:NAD(+)/NADH kinase [Lachnospiraceae bacterium]
MKKILIITNRFKDVEQKNTEKVCAFLNAKGVKVQRVLVDRKVTNLDESLLDETDCAIILGGDGTMMQFANQLSKHDIPMLGINLGHMGYLAEVDCNNVEASLNKVLSGDYTVQERMMINGMIIKDGNTVIKQNAINDVVITRCGKLQVLNFNIFINGKLLKNYNADGVILSTPTGSTAYNLSAGGPIVDPGAEILIVTPIAPHTLMNRSLVLKASDYVEIEILSTHEEETDELMELNFDGKESVKLSAGDRVGVTSASRHVKMIRLNEVSFLEVLHNKMKES